jgi:hypothetical protein
VLEESSLHRMKLALFCEAFDGGDFILLMHHREGEAGIDAPAVHVHGASPALPVITSLFRSKEAEILAQGVEQRHARFDLQLVELPVDFQLDRNGTSGIRTAGACGDSMTCGVARSKGPAVAAIPAVATLVKNERRVTPFVPGAFSISAASGGSATGSFDVGILSASDMTNIEVKRERTNRRIRGTIQRNP